MEKVEVRGGGGEWRFASIVPAALNAEGEVSNAEEEEIGRRGEESLVGRDVLGTPNDNGSVIDATLPPRIPPRLRASQNSALKDASRRPPVSLSSARSRPARSSRNVLLLRAAGDVRPYQPPLVGRDVLGAPTWMTPDRRRTNRAKPRARSRGDGGGQSREEFFAGRRAWRRACSPRWSHAEAKDAHSVHLGDGLPAGAREKARSGLLPAASRS